MDIIAHRGASAGKPENTLESVKRAWSLGADGVEVDVQKTADDQLILMHDETTLRTTGEDFEVQRTEYGVLRSLNPAHGSGTVTTIPLLDEVLAETPQGKIFYIDLKGGKELTAPLCSLLTDEIKRRVRIILVGKDRSLMSTLAGNGMGLSVARNIHHTFHPGQGGWPVLDDLLDELTADGLQGAGFHAGPWLGLDEVHAIHQAGLFLFAWTVDDPGHARDLREFGVDHLCTNDPAVIMSSLKCI